MKAITEDFLRLELRNAQPETYYVPEGKILTPAAREYLQKGLTFGIRRGLYKRNKSTYLLPDEAE